MEEEDIERGVIVNNINALLDALLDALLYALLVLTGQKMRTQKRRDHVAPRTALALYDMRACRGRETQRRARFQRCSFT